MARNHFRLLVAERLRRHSLEVTDLRHDLVLVQFKIEQNWKKKQANSLEQSPQSDGLLTS